MRAPWVTWHTLIRYFNVNMGALIFFTAAMIRACEVTWQWWESYRRVSCHPWCTHLTSLVVKKNFFSFPVAVNNSIKVGPLVFLLYMFVIMENIMKRPVF
jgi:hypothetical protein